MTTSPVISIRDQGALDLIRSLLLQGISVRIQVSGSSMLPFLQGGETVKLSPITGSTARLGDLLLHISPQNNPLIHRLVRRRYVNKVLHLQTKGDNCACLDKLVSVNQVLARVQCVYAPASITGKNRVTNLYTPAMRLKGFLIAGQGLAGYYLRRVMAVSKSMIIPA